MIRRLTAPLFSALLASAALPAAEQTPGVSLLGSGLMTLPDISTLQPRYFYLGGSFENQDRDPLRMDVNDLSVAWIYGVKPRLETYGHAILSRAVTVSDRTTLLPPPLDIVVPSAASAPRRPFYPFYTAFPYVSRSGQSQVGNFQPADLVIGAKARVAEPAGWRPGLAISGELKVPLTRSLEKLQQGAGTGGVDETLRLTGEWRTKRQAFVTSIAFTHVGQPPFGDRIISFVPGGAGTVTDLPLKLANRVQLGVGIRHDLVLRMSVMAEATRTLFVGDRTPALAQQAPLDLLGGIQFRFGPGHITMGLRFHSNSVPPRTTLAFPLGGLADMTNVSAADRERYLTAIGAASAIPYIRDRTTLTMAFPDQRVPLPPESRIIPFDYLLRSHGHVAYVATTGISFGRSRKR